MTTEPNSRTLTSGNNGPGLDQLRDQSPDLTVDLAPNNPHHLRLANPVMIASGTFGYDGYGRGIIGETGPNALDLGELGAVIPKTVTHLPRTGNPEPRWHPESYREAWEQGDWESGDLLFLNSIGLTNPGIDEALTRLAPVWAQWNATVIFSFSADSAREFAEMAAKTQGIAGFQAIELNLSCPNVADGAMFSHSAGLTAEAVAAVRANTTLPVIAKLSPNVPDITQIARAAVDGGADALTLCNTLPALHIDIATKKPVLGNTMGGLSGMALRPISLALVYQAAAAVDVPIIGVGGIFNAQHVAEYILAGASAVQIGSANLVGLNAPWRVLQELRNYLTESGHATLRELTGAARAGAKV